MEFISRAIGPIRFDDWTTSQRELWPLHELEASGAALNTGQFTEIFGPLDEEAFCEASRRVVAECEALRLRIVDEAEGPVQWIAPADDWSPDRLVVAGEDDPQACARQWMDRELLRSFELDGPPFSWTLIKLAGDHYIWCFIVVQLALDGFGRNLVARRLAKIYSELIGGGSAGDAPLAPAQTLRDADAAYRHSEEFAASRRYWAGQTADLPATARLTAKPSGGSYLGARHVEPLPPETATAIRAVMAKTGVSMSGLFAILSALYINRLTGAPDVVVGLLVAARTDDALRSAPGIVSNTVPLRLKLAPGATLEALVAQTRARIREALRHQRFPLSEMKAELPDLTGEMFAIAVNVMKFDYALAFGALETKSHNLSNGPVDDLSLSVFEQPGEDGLQIALNGNTGRYTADELQAHYQRMLFLLRGVCAADPSLPVAAIPCFSDAERIDVGGVRVSLEEVAALIRRAGVAGDVAIVPRVIDGRTRLVARITPGPGADAIDAEKTRELLARELSDSTLVAAVEVAAGANSLREPAAQPAADVFPDQKASDPANPHEALICGLFAQLLNVADVSALDSFFEIGGHSLLAARLASRLSRELHVKVPLRAIFEHPTPRGLARAFATSTPSPASPAEKPLLIIFPGGGVLSREVIKMRALLSNDYATEMIDYPDWRAQWEIFFNFPKYLEAIIAQIRNIAPTSRPLSLLGYSFGAGVAYVMAVLLRREGYDIRLLGLIDGRSPVMEITPERETSETFITRIVEFFRRDGVSRSRQLGRYIGLRAKRPFIARILRMIGPYLPDDPTSEFSFYMTAFINASIPMQEIREWTQRLPESERALQLRTVLVRSMDNGDDWPVDLGWSPLAPSLDLRLVPGDHFSVIGDGNLANVREYLKPVPQPAAAGAGLRTA